MAALTEMAEPKTMKGAALKELSGAINKSTETAMNWLKRIRTYLLLWSLAGLLQPLHVIAQQNSDASKILDGQHDFDFSMGTWKTHLRRLQHPLSGLTNWVEYEGISVVGKVWNGRGSLGETKADGPAGHLEALSLRLYNPQAHQSGT